MATAPRRRRGRGGRSRRPAGRDRAAGRAGDEVVLQAGANALQVGAQPGVVEVVAGAFLRSGMAACSARRSIRSSWRASAASCSRSEARLSAGTAGCSAENDTANTTASAGHADVRRLVCPIVPFPVEADGQMLWRALALRRREWELRHDRICWSRWPTFAQCLVDFLLASAYHPLVELANLAIQSHERPNQLASTWSMRRSISIPIRSRPHSSPAATRYPRA
jgi:hypothetical protein